MPPYEADAAPVRVLLLEDNPTDAELIERELAKLGVPLDTRCVSEKSAYIDALTEFDPQVILSDHSVPRVGGQTALELARQICAGVPFILVTGSLDEETAVRYMKSGAADYVLKDRLLRLSAAVRAALDRRSDREGKAYAERRYREMFAAAPLAIYRATVDGDIQTVNPAFARLLGYDRPADLVGLSMIDDVFRIPADREQIVEAFSPGGGVADVEVQWKRRDGTPLWVQLSVHVRHDEPGHDAYVEGFARDITTQKELERQLLHAQKMEAIGRLAGGIAHDFNNLLTAIIGFGEILDDSLGDNVEGRRDLGEMRSAAERAATLTRQLLAFSRKQVLETKIVDLNDLLTQLERMLERVIGEDIELRLALAPDLGLIRADPGQIEQVVLNLAVNARDAMPSGGKLTFETDTVELDEEYAARHVGVEPGHYVMVAVSDTGSGMDETTRARVFEPFFTTKGPGKGTGLGLSTVYGIIQQSGGNVWVYSEVGRGTTFKIYLPRAEQADVSECPAPAPVETSGTETILLVEDAEPVRTLTRRVLEDRGYTVLEAQTGAEGQVAAQLHRGSIDLLLTDVVLPDVGGLALAERLVGTRPGLQVLYMSGYTDESVVHHGMLERGAAYLQKPFTPQTLARRVREVLDAS